MLRLSGHPKRQRMHDLLQRLRERKLVQWALAYVAAAFALIQVLDVVAQRFGWPDALERALILALALGFFVTIVLAWYHGEKGVQKVTGSELLILALLLAVGGGLLWRIAKQNPQSPEAEAAVPTATGVPGKSIAVLAFTDLSPNHDQGYFSDGMSEEILNALAQINDLKVAGRTSSFYYKGRDEDLRTIGKSLGVANILEGSVRKQGDKVRITAQLIRVADDSHLWSQAYDGDLSDIFKTQENVARAITDKLQVTLVGSQKTQLVAVATLDTQAHSLYLQAREAYRARGSSVQRSIDLYRAALKRDPKFALAWAGLCGSLNVLPYYLPHDQAARLPDIYREAEEAGLRAIELDPDLATPHVMLGNLYANHWRWRDAERQFERAQALAPPDSEFYFAYTDWLGSMGRADAALDAARRAVELDPKAPAPRNLYGYLLSYSGHYADAVVQLEAGHALAPDMKYINRNLVIAYAQAGRLDDAQKLIRTTLAALRSQGAEAADIAWFERVTESMLTVARDPSRYDAVRRTLPDKDLFISFLHPIHVDDLFVFVKALFFDRPGTGTDGPAFLRSHAFDGLRKNPRYLRLLHQAGFDDAGVPI